jgi:antitoxin MazE
MQASKWGNSFAAWFPKKLLEKVGLAKTGEPAMAISDEQFLRQLRALQRPRPKDFIWKRVDVSAR